MIYKFSDLKTKEIIHITNGDRIGFISDLEIDSDTGKIVSLCVPGSFKAFGLFGKTDTKTIRWQDIKKVGDDLIIIDNKNDYENSNT